MAQSILVVDDDALMRRSLAFNLQQAGYRAQTAGSAEEALALARREPFDLVLLDIGLPGMDGLQALRHFQERNIAVILLTARRRGLDEVLGLELGAEDYITKPFDTDVLLARVKKTLRQPRRAVVGGRAAQRLVVGDLVIDAASHTVTVGSRPVELPPRDFDLLFALASRAGQVVPVDELLERVWGAGFEGQPAVLYVCLRRLREQIEEDPAHPRRIVTVRGVGYKLIPQESSG